MNIDEEARDLERKIRVLYTSAESAMTLIPEYDDFLTGLRAAQRWDVLLLVHAERLAELKPNDPHAQRVLALATKMAAITQEAILAEIADQLDEGKDE